MKICPACSREYGEEMRTCLDDGVGLIHLDTGAGKPGHDDLIGTIVDGRYKIEKIVGRGGMGTVYSCHHVVVGKSFAIKVLRSGIERSEEILQRFIREAQAANSVKSRHICEMSDFGQLPNGAFYVVMELLQGVSLTRALREKRLKRREIRKVFIQIAETLEKAHKQGIVHRDLKPDNVVLVEDDGDPFFVKLVDFGIAKMMESEASNLTETGVILGTPYYMSPEQARGENVDHRSDIYALGVMMYRAFTGKLPFVADTAMGVLTRHLTERPEQPSKIADMDPITERLILRCMEKKPIDRFQSMADVADVLAQIGDQGGPRAPHTSILDELSTPLYQHKKDGIDQATRMDTPVARVPAGGGPASVGMPGPVPVPAPPATRSPNDLRAAPTVAEGGGRPSGAPVPPSGAHSVGGYSTPEIHAQTMNTGAHAVAAANVPYDISASGNHLIDASIDGVQLPPGYDPHVGESHTNRGVVARLEPDSAKSNRKAVLFGVAALVVTASLGGLTALLVFGGSGEGTSPKPASASTAAATASAEPSATASAATSAAASATATPSATASAASSSTAAPVAAPRPRLVPYPKGRPKPAPEPAPPVGPAMPMPRPEIDNPFDN